jgi:hypothetical protein
MERISAEMKEEQKARDAEKGRASSGFIALQRRREGL